MDERDERLTAALEQHHDDAAGLVRLLRELQAIMPEGGIDGDDCRSLPTLFGRLTDRLDRHEQTLRAALARRESVTS